ncbi:MAG: DegT/DnrJ/EryC1/StrS family aminotransferase [Hungatella sp.]|nr:DegT/DnrJ/EryC1/StrS family aminotransferase [Hungatella sp.]
MEKRNIQFSPPDITDAEINEVVDTLRSGWITTGPKTKESERLISQRCNTEKAVCLNSNTACSEMTLKILGIGPGDEVIVPAYTYTASASVIEHVGATPVLIDCEKGKFTWDYKKLESAITDKTKVIIPVDLFGIPADYDRVFEIVERKKKLFHPTQNTPAGQSTDLDIWGFRIQKGIGRVIVMADAAHSFGAVYRGKPVGSIADITNFSFHAVKNMTTAEGGAVVWKNIPGIDNDELYHLYMLYSLHGQSKDALSKNQLGAWEYNIVAPWFKCNMTDVHAAIGLGQIRRYDDILARKRQIIEKYDVAFKELPVRILQHYTKEYQSSGHLYIMSLTGKTREEANQFIAGLANLGIASNVHYKPLPLHTAYMSLGYNANDYPNCIEQFNNEVTLPLHTVLSNDDVDYIIWGVKKIYHELFG